MVVVVGTHLLDVVVVVVDVDFLQGLVQLEVEVDGVEEKKGHLVVVEVDGVEEKKNLILIKKTL